MAAVQDVEGGQVEQKPPSRLEHPRQLAYRLQVVTHGVMADDVEGYDQVEIAVGVRQGFDGAAVRMLEAAVAAEAQGLLADVHPHQFARGEVLAHALHVSAGAATRVQHPAARLPRTVPFEQGVEGAVMPHVPPVGILHLVHYRIFFLLHLLLLLKIDDLRLSLYTLTRFVV